MSLIGQIFKRDDGKAIKFYFVEGPTHVCKSERGAVQSGDVIKLSAKIERYGGRVVQDMNHAAVWIVNPVGLGSYRKYCKYEPTHRAEDPHFIQKCIEQRAFLQGVVPIPQEEPMGEFQPGTSTSFTTEQVEQLCQWHARNILKGRGYSRTGRKTYQAFIAYGKKFRNTEWELATSHPRESWRGYYKRHANRLDVRIKEIAEETGIIPSSKLGFSNPDEDEEPTSARNIKGKAIVVVSSDSEDDEEELRMRARKRARTGSMTFTPRRSPVPSRAASALPVSQEKETIAPAAGSSTPRRVLPRPVPRVQSVPHPVDD
ncbi:BRCT domain-containing protein [Phanerochaete sordida]|uniref:BRCT domain-containing protein n=1 Tax=Phanerochaete sordida TaxID=48140 RepID=A0A9P3G306_9APHY|nr:BRCT domain-containing protein [Phanerochaete sordida]